MEGRKDRAAAEAEAEGLHGGQQLQADLTTPNARRGARAAVAERIAYLMEEYNLLPKTRFGARKQMSTTRALSYVYGDVFRV